MKRYLATVWLAAFALPLFTGCAVIPSTTFTEYRGAAVMTGTGGTVRTVDGIDFWTTGEPDRKFQVIGIINDDRNDKAIWNVMRDASIARLAKEHGGDAVVVIDSARSFQGFDANVNTYSGGGNVTGQANYRSSTRLAVVKYLP